MEGKVMDAAETNAIAKLPNREGMLSMFAGAPVSYTHLAVYKRQIPGLRFLIQDMFEHHVLPEQGS